MRARITKANVGAAEHVFDEPLDSEVFDPWPLEPVLEFIEATLKRHHAGLARLREVGLIHAICGNNTEFLSRRQQFSQIRAFGNRLSLILDKVERSADRMADLERLHIGLRNWHENMPA